MSLPPPQAWVLYSGRYAANSPKHTPICCVQGAAGGAPGAAAALGSAGYRRWAASLPGQQVHPPATSPTGFVAATRMLAKLSLVSRRVFPLPCTAGVPCLLQQPSSGRRRQSIVSTPLSLQRTARQGRGRQQMEQISQQLLHTPAPNPHVDIGWVIAHYHPVHLGSSARAIQGVACQHVHSLLAGSIQRSCWRRGHGCGRPWQRWRQTRRSVRCWGRGPRAADLAHRAASWQRTWQPRLAQQLKAEQHADVSTHTAGPQPPSLPLHDQQAVAHRQPPAPGQQAFQLSAAPPSQPQCQVVPLQQSAQPMQVIIVLRAVTMV